MDSRIDKVKLNHWLNIRKTTLDVLNESLKKHINFELTFENLDQLDNNSVEKLAEILAIPKNNILEQKETPSFIYNSKETIENYYEVYLPSKL